VAETARPVETMKSFMDGPSSWRTGAAEPPEMMAALVQRVRTLRASIERSEGYAESTAAVLGNYEERLAEIDAAMRPIQVAAHLRLVSTSLRIRKRAAGACGFLILWWWWWVQVSRQAAQMAHDNIDRAITAANDILAKVVVAREVRASALARPLRRAVSEITGKCMRGSIWW
jgi:hypothetical protein